MFSTFFITTPEANFSKESNVFENQKILEKAFRREAGDVPDLSSSAEKVGEDMKFK